MNLLLNLVRKDFKRSKIITIALTVFLLLSAVFMAGGLRVAGTLMSSLKGFNQLAQPPDYLQLHKGTSEKEQFANFTTFATDHVYIREAQVVEMLNIRNAAISYPGGTMESSLMDNSLIVQNAKFDYLLDLDNQVAAVADGQIGVPVYYGETLGIQVGDTITLQEGNYRKELTVSTLVRDASMNPAITSSKRFLVSPGDLEEIRQQMGSWEYSFEFLLYKGASTSTLEQDYRAAGLPTNGVALTGSSLVLLNSFSFGLTAFIIMALSLFLILIALLCLSYIIRATLAEEHTTIGEMKAIGFPGKSIVKLYQMKYILLTAAAGVLGYLAAIPFGAVFTSSIIRYCGKGTQPWLPWLLALVGILLLSLIVMLRCRRIIRKQLKRTVIELKRGEEAMKNEGHYRLPTAGLRYRNLTVALGEWRCRWKEYSVIFAVFVSASFLILLPMNMKHTVEHPSFITYMGVGQSDIRIDIPFGSKLAEQKAAAQAYLEQDTEIAKYAIFRTGNVQTRNTAGEMEYMRIIGGDESVFPLNYLDGKAPRTDGQREMAISSLYAKDLGKKVGDPVSVTYRGEEILFTVSGIYQDITYGGKTAKATIDFTETDVEVYIIYLDVREGVSVAAKTAELRTLLTESKVTPVDEFIAQTLGGIVDNIRLVEKAAIGIALLFILLITVMFLQLIMAREHREIAIKKAIGFSNRDIRIQLGIRVLLIQVLAIVVGTVLANGLGEGVFSLLLSSMGASRITLMVEPVAAFVFSPAIQLLAVVLTVIAGTKAVERYHIRHQIME